MESIRVTRSQIIDLLDMPDHYFEETLVGAFARVVDASKQYRMCQITRVIKAKEYSLPQEQTRGGAKEELVKRHFSTNKVIVCA